MKICFECGETFNNDGWDCPQCGHSPLMVNGYLSFSPELAMDNEGFDAAHFTDLYDLEAGNFWFKARNRLILWALQHYFPEIHNFMEIGCGTGYVLSAIEQTFPNLNLYGSEINCAGLSYAGKRISNVDLFQMDARKIPYVNEFNVIGAFDVLEHIEDDVAVLDQIYRALKYDGGLIITVPQHPWLWSKMDESAHHVRRYTAMELKEKVVDAGFRIVYTTSFVSFLLPLMMVSRLVKARAASKHDIKSELQVGALINKVMEIVLLIEQSIIRAGISFPMGGSRLLIAKK